MSLNKIKKENPKMSFQKPTYIDESFLIATKEGWCDTRNFNEVIVSYPRLDQLIKLSEPEGPIKVTKINVNENLKLSVKKSFTIKPEVEPKNADDKRVSFSTGNADVATVSKVGKITGVSQGETVITVSALDGSGIIAEIQLIVE